MGGKAPSNRSPCKDKHGLKKGLGTPWNPKLLSKHNSQCLDFSSSLLTYHANPIKTGGHLEAREKVKQLLNCSGYDHQSPHDVCVNMDVAMVTKL